MLVIMNLKKNDTIAYLNNWKLKGLFDIASNTIKHVLQDIVHCRENFSIYETSKKLAVSVLYIYELLKVHIY